MKLQLGVFLHNASTVLIIDTFYGELNKRVLQGTFLVATYNIYIASFIRFFFFFSDFPFVMTHHSIISETIESPPDESENNSGMDIVSVSVEFLYLEVTRLCLNHKCSVSEMVPEICITVFI